MSRRRNSVWPGVLLILAGVLLLIHKLGIYRFSWGELFPFLLILLGIWFGVRIFTENNRGHAFPAALFILFGIYFYLRSSYFIGDLAYYRTWPIMIMIVGLAFLIQYLFRPKDFGLLIPAFIFLIVGATFMAREIGWMIPYEISEKIATYWPLLLVGIGVYLLLSARHKPEKPPESEFTETIENHSEETPDTTDK